MTWSIRASTFIFVQGSALVLGSLWIFIKSIIISISVKVFTNQTRRNNLWSICGFKYLTRQYVRCVWNTFKPMGIFRLTNLLLNFSFNHQFGLSKGILTGIYRPLADWGIMFEFLSFSFYLRMVTNCDVCRRKVIWPLCLTSFEVFENLFVFWFNLLSVVFSRVLVANHFSSDENDCCINQLALFEFRSI